MLIPTKIVRTITAILPEFGRLFNVTTDCRLQCAWAATKQDSD